MKNTESKFVLIGESKQQTTMVKKGRSFYFTADFTRGYMSAVFEYIPSKGRKYHFYSGELGYDFYPTKRQLIDYFVKEALQGGKFVKGDTLYTLEGVSKTEGIRGKYFVLLSSENKDTWDMVDLIEFFSQESPYKKK